MIGLVVVRGMEYSYQLDDVEQTPGGDLIGTATLTLGRLSPQAEAYAEHLGNRRIDLLDGHMVVAAKVRRSLRRHERNGKKLLHKLGKGQLTAAETAELVADLTSRLGWAR